MRRTTVMLPADLQARALRVARSRGVSLGQLVRDALTDRLATANDEARDPLFADDAIYAGRAPADLAAEHDHYLYDR